MSWPHASRVLVSASRRNELYPGFFIGVFPLTLGSKSPCRRDAATSTRDECVPRNRRFPAFSDGHTFI